MANLAIKAPLSIIQETTELLIGGFFLDDFGIVPDVHAEIKFFANIFLKDILLFGLGLGLGLLFSGFFPDDQGLEKAIFMLLLGVLTFYLDLRPASNPGKRNYEVIWMLILDRQPKLFKSFGYYEFTPLSALRKRGN